MHRECLNGVTSLLGCCTHWCEVLKQNRGCGCTQTNKQTNDKPTDIRSLMVTRLLSLNSVSRRFLQCSLGFKLQYIALPFKCMLAVYHSTWINNGSASLGTRVNCFVQTWANIGYSTFGNSQRVALHESEEMVIQLTAWVPSLRQADFALLK